MNEADERGIDEWRDVRNKALAELDMNFAREQCPGAYSDEVLLICMHKARVDCTDLPDQLRLESVEWLRERGFSRIDGMPLPLPGLLPI